MFDKRRTVGGSVVVLLVLAAGGLLLMMVAADQLVLGASRIATRLRMAPVLVGVIVIGLGTSAPEFVVAGLAAARGEVALGLGSLVGSNIVNLTLVLAVAALVAPVAVTSATTRREAPISVAAVTAFAVAVAFGLGTAAGVVLAIAATVAIAALIWAASGAGHAVPATVNALLARPVRLPVEITRAALAIGGTLAGAQLLVVNAAELAMRWGVAPEIIGFTLVAIGTSLPELVTAVQAQRRGESDLLIGNLLGSNMFNSAGGGAVVAIAAGADPTFHFGIALLVVMVLTSVLAWGLLWKGYQVSRKDAVVLLLVYAACLPLLR